MAKAYDIEHFVRFIRSNVIIDITLRNYLTMSVMITLITRETDLIMGDENGDDEGAREKHKYSVVNILLRINNEQRNMALPTHAADCFLLLNDLCSIVFREPALF